MSDHPSAIDVMVGVSDTRYDTRLLPEEEQQFQAWLPEQSARQGRDISRDLADYDLRGHWLQNVVRGTGAPDERGHLSDQFKKPNHPTFSVESQYHGSDGTQGGRWKDLGGGRFRFTAGRTNLEHRSEQELRQYWREAERGNELVVPSWLRRRR
jgi:hypothetical protein